MASQNRALSFAAVWLAACMTFTCGGDGDAPEPTIAVESTAAATATTEAAAPEPDPTDTPVPPTSTAAPTSTSQPATATPVPPTATPAPSVSDRELIELATLIFLEVIQGEYGACDNLANAECPITPRLATRLADPAVRLCRCQNTSITREIQPLPERNSDGGGIVRVTLFDGSLSHDLVVVPARAGWLVDDEYCAGRPETSIHVYAGPC